LLSGGELEKVRVEYENAFDLSVASQYINASTTGMAERQGQTTYIVTATKKGEEHPSKLYFSKENGLIIAMDTVLVSGQGKQNISNDITEYKEFSGMQMPTKMVTKAAGQEVSMEFTDYAFDVEAPPIEPPAEIKAILAEEEEAAPEVPESTPEAPKSVE